MDEAIPELSLSHPKHSDCRQLPVPLSSALSGVVGFGVGLCVEADPAKVLGIVVAITYIYIYICICVYIYMCIYIYIDIVYA